MLELKNITKVFPGVTALDEVTLSFVPGEIHALLGENGAGKSTLMKIISGIHTQYTGEVVLNGECVRLGSYRDALEGGISIVNQEIQVIPEASVSENIMLDKLPKYRNRWGRIDWKKLRREASVYMDMVNLPIPPDTPIGPLSAARKQLVQIAKALAAEASVVLFDEPTSSITEHEAEHLFAIMERLKDNGKTIIFVSHKLEEIFRICDTVSVIRDGKHIATASTGELTRDNVVEMMIGREIMDEHLGQLDVDPESVVLEVKNLVSAGKVDKVSFHLNKGEILGFYGLVGAGRTETARLIIGEDQPDSGKILVDNREVRIRDVADALYTHGIGYVTENRKEEGLWLDFDVETNATLTIWNRIIARFTRYIRRTPQRNIAADMAAKLDIKTTGLDQKAGKLSGGNQQKVSIAKWLAADCRILIIDEPTVGVDIGAKEYIHQLIWNLAEKQRKSIILISSDLPEMVKIARRILVFREGKIVGELNNLTGDPSDSEEVSRQIGSRLV